VVFSGSLTLVTPPLLTLTSPLGGEVWDQGSSHAVTWTASDDQDPSTSLVVFINYTSSAGSGTICGPIPGSPGPCAWIVPTIVATDVVVNGTVVDTGGLKGWDQSGPFTIQAPPNTPPTAGAGPDQDAFKNDPVILDGSASTDPDMEPLTYDWVQTGGPQSVTLVPVNASAVTFTAPTGAGAVGVYTFELTVSDPSRANDTDTVDVNVSNRAPNADAGPDQIGVVKFLLVTLNGLGSGDLDADSLTYLWTAPASIALSNPSDPMPTFTPTRSGSYDFRLQVGDGFGGSATDSVTVSVTNAAPAANAGPDRSLLKGGAVTLDGTGSVDPDGDTLSFSWTQTSSSPVTLTNANMATPSFTPEVEGTYVFTLTVTDGQGGSDTDTVPITVSGVATVIGVEVYAALVVAIIVAALLGLFLLGRRRRKSDPAEEPERRD
jgi:hypothetical protein